MSDGFTLHSDDASSIYIPVSPLKALTMDQACICLARSIARQVELPRNIISPDLRSDTFTCDNEETSDPTNAPFSVFTKNEKMFIALIASLSTLLPPLAGNIFYPVIELIASDLDVSINQINLTITAYLIVQGLAPSFIGNLSDTHGRRPALMLAFTIFIAGCLGAAVPGSYTMLVLMRCLQSAGSSGTVAIASAIVTDIVTSSQRGEYYSYVQLGALVGPSLGPVIGGLVSHAWGWRSIFWFLTSLATVIFILTVLFLPETSRRIVGDGSISAQPWNKPIFGRVREQHKKLSPARFNPFEALSLFFHLENFILLLYSGIIYSTQYYFFATLPLQFQQHYGFTTVSISLVFLATGFGTMLAVILVGRLQDWNFHRHARKRGIVILSNRQQSLEAFPIEVARLQTTFPLLFLSLASLIAYGWLFHTPSPVGPIVLAFLWAAGNAAAFNGFANLIVDLNRDQPGTATASMNMSRNWIGAGVVALSNPLTEGVGIGWANMIIAGYTILLIPSVLLLYYRGYEWRRADSEKRSQASSQASSQA